MLLELIVEDNYRPSVLVRQILFDSCRRLMLVDLTNLDKYIAVFSIVNNQREHAVVEDALNLSMVNALAMNMPMTDGNVDRDFAR
jgi:hypothetical protein